MGFGIHNVTSAGAFRALSVHDDAKARCVSHGTSDHARIGARGLAWIIALAVCSTPTGGRAQSKTENGIGLIKVPRRARISDPTGLSESDKGRLVMAEFARCAVDRRRGALVRILAKPANEIEGKDWLQVATDDCLNLGEMRIKSTLMRGAVFSELYKRRSRASNVGRNWDLPVTPYDKSTMTTTSDPNEKNLIGLLNFADCVVQRSPIATSKMVVSTSLSEPQEKAIAVLQPELGPCLTAGQKIVLSKSILEGAVAEILYRKPVMPTTTASAENN